MPVSHRNVGLHESQRKTDLQTTIGHKISYQDNLRRLKGFNGSSRLRRTGRWICKQHQLIGILAFLRKRRCCFKMQRDSCKLINVIDLVSSAQFCHHWRPVSNVRYSHHQCYPPWITIGEGFSKFKRILYYGIKKIFSLLLYL